MARIIKRTWTSRGPTAHKVKRVSERLRSASSRRSSWRATEQAAAAAPPTPKTLAQLGEEYLAYKRGKGKRSRGVQHTISAKCYDGRRPSRKS